MSRQAVLRSTCVRVFPIRVYYSLFKGSETRAEHFVCIAGLSMDNAFADSGDDRAPVAGPDGSRLYWSSIDPVIAEAVRVMDSRDTWTLDDEPIIRHLMDKVIENMAGSPGLSGFALKEPEKALQIMSWLRSSSALMILHYADEDRHKIINDFLSACSRIMEFHVGDRDLVASATLAVDRFLVFERLAILKRLFSEERASLLSDALRDARKLSGD